MSNSIIIRFKPKGDKELIASLKTLSRLQRQLEGELKKTGRASGLLGRAFGRNQKSATALGNAFSTARSKMLLLSFAMSMGGRQLIDFAQKAAKIESMSRGFNTLSGGVSKSSIALESLQEATNGTMSQFDLFQQANNAMVLGITRNSSEMAEMFDIAQRLGRVLGRDTKSSVESLVTGIGRQSRLMLDNIGIIVKTDKAYENYAAQLGKGKEQLSDSEKRQAFLNAALDAGREKVARLGEEVPTSQDAFDSFAASMDDLKVKLGQAVVNSIKPAAEWLTKLAENTNVDDLKSYLRALRNVGIAMGIYVAWLKRAVIWQVRTGWGALAVVAGVATEAILRAAGAFEEVDTSIESTSSKIAVFNENLRHMTLEQLNAALAAEQRALSSLGARLADSQLAAQVRSNMASIQGMIDSLGDWEGTIIDLTEAQLEADKLLATTKEVREQNLKDQIALVQAVEDADKSTNKYADILAELNQKLLKLNPAFSMAHNQISSVTGALFGAAEAGVHMGRAVENSIRQIVATFLANLATFKLMSMIFPTFAAGATMPSLFGWSPFGHQGGQVQGYATGGVVPPPGIPSYATGGGVDNVPAMLQEGEYVMRRSAVDSIGIENLNRMNRTGQVSGGVTVNFSGNVMSDDFVENEAIPKIKDAIRRGADIGIS